MKRGESLYIPFRNGQSISDSQCKPRMYKSLQNFEKTFPKHNYETKNIELVEYAEMKHGEWIWTENGEADYEQFWVCSVCKEKSYIKTKFCSDCGAKMVVAKNATTERKDT